MAICKRTAPSFWEKRFVAMKIMWKPKSAKADDIIATVVNTAALSVVGVANGRTVPVVILQPDEETLI